MNTRRLLGLSYAALLGGALLWVPACGESGGEDSTCTGDNCDEVDPSKAACKGKVVDGSGLGRDEATIVTNNDQFAKFVLLQGDGCPAAADDVMKKLIKTQGCGADANGTMVVNEKSSHEALQGASPDAQLVAQAQNANRTVVSRQCEEKKPVDPSKAALVCKANDVFEFDFVLGACRDSKNTPKCFTDNSGPMFFQSADCLKCLTGEDGKLHKDDLRTGEKRCVDRDSAGQSGPPAFNLLLSVFSSLDSISQDGLEVIAFDSAEGVFNYYKEGNGKWSFMGNSHDFQQGQGGFCKGCHPGGGLVQKELPSPWFNWEISGDVPHSDKVIENNKEFYGSAFPLGGEGLEVSVVRPGNDVMNQRRVDIIGAKFKAAKDDRSSMRGTMATPESVVFAKQEMTEMLRPLFCTEEITFATETFGMEGIFTPDLLPANTQVNIPSDQYDAAIMELGQVRGTGQLTSKDSSARLARPTGGDVFDSFEGFYPKMVQANLMSDEFIQDLHIIDFTRPLFSDTRCALLEFAPQLTVADIKAADTLAKAIEAGFIRELAGKTGAAADFLANLNAADSAAARNSKVDAFVTACNARAMSDAKGFMKDVVKMVELMRQETEGRLEIIESFLADDVWPSIPGMQKNFSKWNPTTCQLE